MDLLELLRFCLMAALAGQVRVEEDGATGMLFIRRRYMSASRSGSV